MIITCEQCQARFRMADEKLKPGGTKVRCSKCKHVFTVLPPAVPAVEDAVDYGDFNMERVADEAPAPEPAVAAPPPAPPEPVPAAPPEPPLAVEPAAAAFAETELDFSGLEQTLAPGVGTDELAEEFSFADTAIATETPAEVEAAAGAALAGSEATGELDFSGLEQTLAPGSGAGELAEEFSFADTSAATEAPADAAAGSEPPGELDFDATFAETEEPAAPAAGPAEFAFDEELAQAEAATAGELESGGEDETPELSEFGFETEVDAAAPAFGEEPVTAAPAETFEFGESEDFESSAAPAAPAFGEEPAGEGFEFGSGDAFESSAAEAAPVFGEMGGAEASTWGEPAQGDSPSFDFDEPNFETKTGEKVAKGREEAGLSFGEIDFSDGGGDAAPAFGSEPDFSQATLARPAETAPPPPPPPPPPRPAADRPRSAEPLPVPSLPRKSPMSRILLVLALLLLILCGVGGYFYFMGDARKVVDSLLLKAKGEVPQAPVAQQIGLNIIGSSYVSNRDAGQLLVVQGTATNNFTTTRTAISVKGLLLDGAGKVLQQQTVFCGNYLDEEKLRGLKYAQIEEAMNNQFGDSLSNMNVSPGKELRFTIVFRNVPKEMANINVEVVDSKPGGT